MTLLKPGDHTAFCFLQQSHQLVSEFLTLPPLVDFAAVALPSPLSSPPITCRGALDRVHLKVLRSTTQPSPPRDTLTVQLGWLFGPGETSGLDRKEARIVVFARSSGHRMDDTDTDMSRDLFRLLALARRSYSWISQRILIGESTLR